MKTSLRTFFNKARFFRTGKPLWTDDELRALIDREPPPPLNGSSNHWSKRMMIFGALLLTVASTYFIGFPDRQSAISTAERPHIAAPIPESSITNQNKAETEKIGIKPTEKIGIKPAEVVVPDSIQGITMLELDDAELAKIGVMKTKGGFALQARISVDFQNPAPFSAFLAHSQKQKTGIVFQTDKLRSMIRSLGEVVAEDLGVIHFSVNIDTLDLRGKVISPKEDSATIYPLVITHESRDVADDAKSSASFYGSVTDSMFNAASFHAELTELYELYSDKPTRNNRLAERFPLVSKLIPVRLKMGGSTGNRMTTILWFYPSATFIDALPKRYAEQILQERNRINVVEIEAKQNGILRPKRTGDYQYSDVARAESGAITIESIGPNPARNQATVFFSLTEERSVYAVLYDFSGRQIGTLARLERVGRGTKLEIPVRFGEIPAGAYLLSLVTDKGEQAIQRLIIQD